VARFIPYAIFDCSCSSVGPLRPALDLLSPDSSFSKRLLLQVPLLGFTANDEARLTKADLMNFYFDGIEVCDVIYCEYRNQLLTVKNGRDASVIEF
jgi:hypothetical protein